MHSYISYMNWALKQIEFTRALNESARVACEDTSRYFVHSHRKLKPRDASYDLTAHLFLQYSHARYLHTQLIN